MLSNVFAWEGAVGVASLAERGRIGSHRFMTYAAASDGDVDLSYLRYFLLTEAGLALLSHASPGSAGRNKTLAIDRFEALEIPLPDIGDQRRVAGKLDAIISTTERLSGLMAHWSRVQVASIAAVAQRNDLTDEAKRSAGWQYVRLGDVLTPSPDVQRVARDGVYANVGVFSFGRGLFEKPPVDGSTTSSRTLNRLRAGQFMYSRLFAFEGAYAEVTPRFDGYFVSNEFPTFDADPDRAMAGFIAAYLRSPSTWADLASSSKGLGVRRQRIQPEKLLAFRIWLPPLETQERAVAAISRLSRCAEMRATSHKVVAALRSATLNRAFAGLL